MTRVGGTKTLTWPCNVRSARGIFSGNFRGSKLKSVENPLPILLVSLFKSLALLAVFVIPKGVTQNFMVRDISCKKGIDTWFTAIL